MTANALQFNRFEMKSNENDKTVDLRGSGNPIIEYRESVFMPYVEITAYIVDTGNTLPADDGTGAGVGLLEDGFGQGTETVLFNIEDGVLNFPFDKTKIDIDLKSFDDLQIMICYIKKNKFFILFCQIILPLKLFIF